MEEKIRAILREQVDPVLEFQMEIPDAAVVLDRDLFNKHFYSSSSQI